VTLSPERVTNVLNKPPHSASKTQINRTLSNIIIVGAWV